MWVILLRKEKLSEAEGKIPVPAILNVLVAQMIEYCGENLEDCLMRKLALLQQVIIAIIPH